jgi:tape measure domain-containing protein
MAREIRVALILDDRDFKRGVRSARSELQGLEQQGKKTGDTIKSNLMDQLSAIGFAAAAAGILKLANDFQSLQNKLIAVTGSQAGATEAFNNIKNIAEATRSPIGAIGDLYSKLAIATKEAGASAQEVSALTTTFAQTLQLSGTSGAQAAAAILQFGQAMASGKLSGDEFRAMMEYNPVLMMKMADAIDIPVGQLKKLASEGALTAKAVELAMKAIAPEVQSEFDKMETTVSQSFTLIGNRFIELTANIESKFGVFSGLANLIKSISENVGILGGVIALAFGAGVARLVFGLATAMIWYRSQVVKTSFAQATLLALGGPAGIAALAAGVVAAGAAYYALSNLMEENTAIAEEKAKADEEAFAAKTAEAAANAELAKQEIARGAAEAAAAKEREKAAQKAAQEAAARIRQAVANLQRVRENTAELKVETAAMAEKLAMDLRLVGSAEDYVEQQQKLFDINKARDKLIADIQAKELSTNPAQNARLQAQEIAKVNAEYDKQAAALGTLIAIRIEQSKLDTTRDVSRIGREGAAAVASIEDEINARNYLFEYQKNNAIKTSQINRKYADEEAVLREKSKNGDKTLLDTQLAGIQERKDAELAALRATTTAEENKTKLYMSFSEGLAEASREATRQVLDEAEFAKQIFNNAMNDFSNAILKFVETGKLSFKDLFRSLMAEMIKMQAKKLFLQFFGGDGLFGKTLGIKPTPTAAPAIPGLATGGPAMAGQPYIVGERGPELFVPSGPGTVIPNNRLGGSGGGIGGVTQITYNIQAVDALSFKQLVARDPEFIYSVSQAGARRLPR